MDCPKQSSDRTRNCIGTLIVDVDSKVSHYHPSLGNRKPDVDVYQPGQSMITLRRQTLIETGQTIQFNSESWSEERLGHFTGSRASGAQNTSRFAWHNRPHDRNHDDCLLSLIWASDANSILSTVMKFPRTLDYTSSVVNIGPVFSEGAN